MSSLYPEQIEMQLQELPNWQQDGMTITKTYEFADFASAISFMTHVAFYAESLEHHPIWQNNYNLVSVRIGANNQSTMHSRDIQLAKRMETVYRCFSC